MTGSAGIIAIWAAALIVASLLGFWIVLRIRHRALSDQTGSGLGLTLADLRRLHASGQLSDEEFDAARAAIVGAAGGKPQGARPSTGHGQDGFHMQAAPGTDLTGDPLPKPDQRE